ncbi:MAG: hypothetical protein ACP5PT_08360, partial [Brevinematia bacterium]
GKVIYSYANYKGGERYLHIFDSLEDALNSGILGDKIMYVFPIGISGENKTEIILKNTDIYKILSLQENKEIFENGRIAIILRQ